MESTLNDANTDSVWQQLAPLLEEAMTQLSEKERTLIALRFFERKSALEDLEKGNVQSATQKLRGALTHLLNQGDTELAATVQTELNNLEKGRMMSPEGRKTIRFESGKTVRLNKS